MTNKVPSQSSTTTRELESFDLQISVAKSINDYARVRSRIESFLKVHPDNTEATILLDKLTEKRTNLGLPNMAVSDDRTVGIGPSGGTSERSWALMLLLCFFLGAFGVHRFYAGKNTSGILMFLTLGIFGIWTLIDFVLILTGSFSDTDGGSIRR